MITIYIFKYNAVYAKKNDDCPEANNFNGGT